MKAIYGHVDNGGLWTTLTNDEASNEETEKPVVMKAWTTLKAWKVKPKEETDEMTKIWRKKVINEEDE